MYCKHAIDNNVHVRVKLIFCRDKNALKKKTILFERKTLKIIRKCKLITRI